MTKIHELSEKDNNTTLAASKDDKVNITLSWKPASGFCWQESDGIAGAIERVEHSGDSETPGAAAVVKFCFRVLRSGFITLNYARPWDENKQPMKWFTVTIQVS